MSKLISLGTAVGKTNANQLTTSADGAGVGVCPGGLPTFVRSRFGTYPCR